MSAWPFKCPPRLLYSQLFVKMCWIEKSSNKTDRSAPGISRPPHFNMAARNKSDQSEAWSASWRLGVRGVFLLCAVVCGGPKSGAGCEGRCGWADAVGCADGAVLDGLVLWAAGNRHLSAAVLLIQLWNTQPPRRQTLAALKRVHTPCSYCLKKCWGKRVNKNQMTMEMFKILH